MSLILGLLLSSFFPILSILLYFQTTIPREEEAIGIALSFLRGSPTFRFDGKAESVEVQGVEQISAQAWRIVIYFECRHSGYGDRSGRVLLPVITPHTIKITVERDEVVEAVIDGVWDELHQKAIGG